MVQWDHEAFLAELRHLVSIDSGSSDRDGVAEVANCLRETYEKLGLHTEITEFEEAGCCLKASNSTDGKADLLMVGHMDTVFRKGTAAERPFAMDAEKAYGPGVADMKAGNLMIGRIAQFLLEEMPEVRFTIAHNGDEETGSLYSKQWLQNIAKDCDCCMVFEPGRPGGIFVKKRKGSAEYKITFHGRAVHAGIEPEKGASAVVEMARWILELNSLNRYDIGTSVNVGVVSGGTASNVIAGEACCVVDLRYESLDELNRIRDAIRALSETVSVPGVQVEAVENFYCAPMVADEQSERMAQTLQEVAEAYQLPIGFVATGGSSDANNISEMGVPVLDGCGPCGGNLHSDAEFLLLDSIPQRYTLITETIRKIMNRRENHG